jgi:hypothetical protein
MPVMMWRLPPSAFVRDWGNRAMDEDCDVCLLRWRSCGASRMPTTKYLRDFNFQAGGGFTQIASAFRMVTRPKSKLVPILIPACRRVDPKFRDPIHSVRMGTYEMPGRSSRVDDDHALLLL